MSRYPELAATNELLERFQALGLGIKELVEQMAFPLDLSGYPPSEELTAELAAEIERSGTNVSGSLMRNVKCQGQYELSDEPLIVMDELYSLMVFKTGSGLFGHQVDKAKQDFIIELQISPYDLSNKLTLGYSEDVKSLLLHRRTPAGELQDGSTWIGIAQELLDGREDPVQYQHMLEHCGQLVDEISNRISLGSIDLL